MMQPLTMRDPIQFDRRTDVPVTSSATLADGTEIRLYLPIRTIKARVISCVNVIGRGVGYPKAGEEFDLFFKFESEEYAMVAFTQMAENRATLLTYKNMIDPPRYAVCIGG
jgi:hypothetical protein